MEIMCWCKGMSADNISVSARLIIGSIGTVKHMELEIKATL